MSLSSLDRLVEARQRAASVQLPDGILRHRYCDATGDIAAWEADHCKRQAVTVQYAYDNLVDKTIYYFDTKAYEFGDPWVMIDGIDRETRPNGQFILCYGRVGELRLNADDRVFASRLVVEKTSNVTLPKDGFTGRQG